MGILNKVFGTYSSREIKRVLPLQQKVLELEETYRAMSDDELKAMTPKLRERLAQGEPLDSVLPDAFATCREASDRVLGMRHFPVQVIGGIILHQGRIAEMKTGEGKTLVATLPAYLNALTGKGVHIVTVNDYLAKRDSEWMGKVYRFLGLTVGLIVHGLTTAERREAYGCDITYGTNNEFGFDYLRDNMVIYKTDKVQRGHNYAIVDEVDSILIDEARTPLIISGQGDKSTDLYEKADRFANTLKCYRVAEADSKEEHDDVDGDYIVDEKAKTATLTASGVKKAEEYFGLDNLTDGDNMQIQHHINQAIKAHGIMQRDVDYVVKDGEVIIVDEFTGRLMEGRRYNEGLHQAIEAKEGVKVERESKTLATITFQNFFRMYDKLAGMTGTALTEADEFMEIYKLDVVEIPTNKPIQRHDHPDVVYKTETAKFHAVIENIVECHEKGQPVLVGTISIEKSELLSQMLKRRGIRHEVLNAKYHDKEAEIVAQAGKYGAVTIATNMAGRGTDIMLGGNAEYLAKADLRREGYDEETINEATGFADTHNEEILAARRLFREKMDQYRAEISVEAEKVREAGGLFIIGTERHESRRIDNQLRGRSGRQGDPGETRFFLSLEDDLMRLFGGERIQNMMDMIGAEDDMPIEAKILSNSIESAQSKVEGPQLRHPQKRPPVRRRHEPPARDDLRPAGQGARRRRHQRHHQEYDHRDDRFGRRPLPRRQGGPRQLEPRGPARLLHGLAHHPRRPALHHRTARRDYRRRDQAAAQGARGKALRRARGAVHLPDYARGRARRAAAQRRHQVDAAHRRHGGAQARHVPALLRPEGPGRRVPHRGLRHVRRDDRVDPRGHRQADVYHSAAHQPGAQARAGRQARAGGLRQRRHHPEQAPLGQKGRTQRSLPLRQRKKVQKVLRPRRVTKETKKRGAARRAALPFCRF